jgi:hypothetical protein
MMLLPLTISPHLESVAIGMIAALCWAFANAHALQLIAMKAEAGYIIAE